jgi:hypothetical protein
VSEPSSEWLSTQEAAHRAGVSERTISEWMAKTKVGFRPHPDNPGRWRQVNRASLEAHLLGKARKAAGNFRRPSEERALPASDQLAEVLTEVRELRAQLADVLARLPAPAEPAAEAVAEAPSAALAEGDRKPLTRWERYKAWWRRS